jgi:hypothetical protein
MGFTNLEPGQVRFSRPGSGFVGSPPTGYHAGGGSSGSGGCLGILACLVIAGLFGLHDSCSNSGGSSPTLVESPVFSPSGGVPFSGAEGTVALPDVPTDAQFRSHTQRFRDLASSSERDSGGRSGSGEITVLPLTSCADDHPTAPGCPLPDAPLRPGKIAAFTFRATTQDPGATQQSDASASAIVVSADHVVVHVVKREEDLPPEAKYGTSFYPSMASLGGGLKGRRLSTLVAGVAPPIILYGDVAVDVGPLVGDNQMLSMLVTLNSGIKRFEMVYGASSPRGPPRRAREQHVYIVGTFEHYQGPDQHDRSVLAAGFFDIDLAASSEQEKIYEAELVKWRRDVASTAGIDASLLYNAFTDVDVRKIIASQRDLAARKPRDPFSDPKSPLYDPNLDFARLLVEIQSGGRLRERGPFGDPTLNRLDRYRTYDPYGVNRRGTSEPRPYEAPRPVEVPHFAVP